MSLTDIPGARGLPSLPRKGSEVQAASRGQTGHQECPCRPTVERWNTQFHETQCLNPRETYSGVISGGGWASLTGSDAVEKIASFWEDGALRLGPFHAECRADGLQGCGGGCELGFSACLSAVSCVLLDAANRQLESLIDKPDIGGHWSPLDFLDFRGWEAVISGSFLESVAS